MSGYLACGTKPAVSLEVDSMPGRPCFAPKTWRDPAFVSWLLHPVAYLSCYLACGTQPAVSLEVDSMPRRPCCAPETWRDPAFISLLLLWVAYMSGYSWHVAHSLLYCIPFGATVCNLHLFPTNNSQWKFTL